MKLAFLYTISLIFSFSIFAQDFVTREGSQLFHHGEEITLEGMAFGNKVWEDEAIPDDHHDEQSYEELHAIGMNTIRFYMNYITFEDDNNPYSYKDEGWAWIDQNIEWAENHDMYLILNMHVPQGGFQSQCEGQALWQEEENRARLANLWKAIAARYQDEPQIAGFDIVNEPTPDASVEQWSTLAQRIIDSIRSVDNNHLIIAERAIAVDCDYDYNDGNYNYPDIEEENLMYTVHMYEPYAFTHQNLEWAETGDGGSYPDESIVSAPGDATYATGQYDNPTLPSGDSDWQYYEGEPFHVDTDTLVVGNITFLGNGLEDGIAFYDNITLSKTDAQGNELEELHSFSITDELTYWFWSEEEDGGYEVTSPGYDSDHAVQMTGTSGNASLTLPNFTFVAEEGTYYKVSGWMKGENIPTGSNVAITTEFQHSPSGQSASVRNYDNIKNQIESYADYIQQMGYPVYFGEFGVARNAFEDDKGGERWVADVLDIFDNLGFHYTYHSYREDAFGYYTGWDGQIDRSTRNDKLYNVFVEALNPILNISLTSQDEAKTKGNIYPNPFNTSYTVKNPYASDTQLKMYNASGKLVFQSSIEGHSHTTIPANELPSGMYHVILSSGDLRSKYKLVKE